MFENAGAKLKALAWFNFIICIIGGFVIGNSASKAAGRDALVFIMYIALFAFIGWLTSIFIYAFGEMCENIQSIKKNTSEQVEIEKIERQKKNKDTWVCTCGTRNPNSEKVCKNCSKQKT